jgi:hypothetical protein
VEVADISSVLAAASYRFCCELHMGLDEVTDHTEFMKILHSPHHWIAVAIVLAVALLTVPHVYGQHNDAAAMFEGRPAMAGAQAGTGAMAGPAQGGIGQQGSQNSGLALKPPSGLRDMPQGTVDPAADAIAVNRAVKNDRDVVPKDNSFAPEQRSAARKIRKAARTVRNQSHYGVATVQ